MLGGFVKSNSNIENWHGADMHVHTPASNDYKGNKDEKEYYRILLSANRKFKQTEAISDAEFDKSIRVIAITDHNSVEGFRYLITKKDETLKLVELLESRNLQINEELKEEAAVYENICILMGVEIKVYPGVHIQIIFREDVTCEEVITFLEKGLNNSYAEVKGNPDAALKWRVDEAFDEVERVFGKKALIIAPHVDRTNGLLEVLKGSAQAKMDALRNPVLKYLNLNNVETRE